MTQTAIPVVEPKRAAEEVRRGAMLIDVRSPSEYRSGHAEGAISIPLAEIASRKAEIPNDRPVYLICLSGHRSRKACEILASLGFSNVRDVEGGTSAWKGAGSPLVIESKEPFSLDQQARVFAGTVNLIGVIGAIHQPKFLILNGIVGVGLIIAGMTKVCGITYLLRYLPWNRDSSCESCAK